MAASSRRLPLLLGVLAIAALLFYLAWHRSTAPPAPRPTAQDDERQVERERRASAAKEPGPRMFNVAGLKHAMEDYKRGAVYPPWSRPHDEGSKWLLQWNKPLTEETMLGDDPEKGLTYFFDADKHHVAYGESYTSWIEVWKKEPDGTRHRVAVDVSSAWVMSTSGPTQGRALALSYHDDGADGDERQGDLRYSNQIIPAEIDKLKKAQSVRIEAIIEAEGEKRRVVRDFSYAPRPTLNILAVSDAASGGSLVVTLAVESFEKGLYTFQANLMSGDGQTAIAWTDQSYPLDSGKQNVTLTFFGKAIRAVGLPGPYVIRDVRGFERFLDNSEANLWFSYPQAHGTRAYALAEFSDGEWDSDEKRAKLAQFQSLIDDTAAGHTGQPTNLPAHIHVGADGTATAVLPSTPWPPPASP
ncbi:MAG TPA: hypothetical protein VGL86_21760 [Polyangia bacterium]|jgi:hypothetical protein